MYIHICLHITCILDTHKHTFKVVEACLPKLLARTRTGTRWSSTQDCLGNPRQGPSIHK